MTEDKELNQEQAEKAKIKKAEVGDIIEIKRGTAKRKKGKVLIVRDNSVIAEIGINPKTDEPIKTVVNHKNYKQIK